MTSKQKALAVSLLMDERHKGTCCWDNDKPEFLVYVKAKFYVYFGKSALVCSTHKEKCSEYFWRVVKL